MLLGGAFRRLATLLKEDTVFSADSKPAGDSMSHYFVNNAALPDGNHEVHALGCSGMPVDKRYLGNFEDAAEAMMEARKDFWLASACGKCGHGRRTEATTTTTTRLSVSGIHSMLEKFT
jgi:hypothetical protein